MHTCMPRASEPGWLFVTGPAGCPGRARAEAAGLIIHTVAATLRAMASVEQRG